MCVPRFVLRTDKKILKIVQLFQDAKHLLKPTGRDILLSVSQNTAVECHDKLVAAGAIPLNKNIPNDATCTNSCAFLSVLITDLLVGQTGNVTLTALDTAKRKMEDCIHQV